MPFEKIKKQSLADQVFNSLKQEILDQNFEVDSKLPSEAMLSKQFGVSKATIKIVLQRLVTLGLIETKVGQGSFVRQFDTNQYLSQVKEFILNNHDISQMAEYRFYTEMATIRLAVKKAAEENFSRMEELLKQMDEAAANNDIALRSKIDYQFHLEICRATGNNFFIHTYETIGKMIRQHTAILNNGNFRYIYNKKPGEDVHWKLLQAMKDRDIEACRNCYIEMFSIDEKTPAAESAE